MDFHFSLFHVEHNSRKEIARSTWNTQKFEAPKGVEETRALACRLLSPRVAFPADSKESPPSERVAFCHYAKDPSLLTINAQAQRDCEFLFDHGISKAYYREVRGQSLYVNGRLTN